MNFTSVKKKKVDYDNHNERNKIKVLKELNGER